MEKGGTALVVLNIANDIAVAAFLNEHIKFIDIPILIENAISQHEWSDSPDIETIFHTSKWTTQYIQDKIAAFA